MNPCSKCDTPNFHPRVSVKSDEILQELRFSVGFRDHARINSLLHDAEKDLDDYDTEIARLETAISLLKRKRACLEGHMVKYRSLLSPIRRLPPELLSLIFLLCRGELENRFILYESGTKMPAVVLTQVCTGWRQVALDTPSIWSNTSFYLGPPEYPLDEEHIKSILPLIHLFFGQSSQFPLNLTLYF
ncbi:hypothetical protein K435DRAFT_699142, partial [Dendrothele bispora CBS 962.96]